MGQQQLLLIVLSVILVGLAMVVGINIFNVSAEEGNKDGISSDCMTLGMFAQAYYKKPGAMGGGSNTFTGWIMPVDLINTPNGTYVVSPGAQVLIFTGLPFASTGYTWQVVTTVTPISITTIISEI